VVEAESPELAAEEYAVRRSIWDLKHGVIAAVWRLGNFPSQFHFQYDGEPLTESHGATDANLVMRPLGNPSVAGASTPRTLFVSKKDTHE
jgi:hypothetical protein